MTVVEHEVARPTERALEPPTVTDADVLTRAADILEEWDWTQGCCARTASGVPTSVERAHAFCFVGALIRARLDFGYDRDNAELRRLARYSGVGPTWNDEPGRTKTEVVAALRAAATRALPQGCAT